MDRSGLDRDLADLLQRAFAQQVDVDVAARHLWVLHGGRRPPAPPSAGRTRPPRAAAPVLVGALLLVLSSVAVAADEPLPGDMMSSLRRGVERAQLMLPRSETAEARFYLRLAEMRLAEARRAAGERPDAYTDLVADALRHVSRAERVGGAAVAAEAAIVRARADRGLADTETQLRQVPAAGSPAPPRGAPQPAADRSPAPAPPAVPPPEHVPDPVMDVPAETITATVPREAHGAPDPVTGPPDDAAASGR